MTYNTTIEEIEKHLKSKGVTIFKFRPDFDSTKVYMTINKSTYSLDKEDFKELQRVGIEVFCERFFKHWR